MAVLEKPILVLDRNMQPCKVSPVKDVLPLVCVDKARVIDHEFNQHTFEDWVIYSEIYIQETGDVDNVVVHSPSVRILVPEAIVLLDYIRNPQRHKRIRFSRQNLFRRDKYTCQYCGVKKSRKDLTMDHIHPKSQGGPTSWENCTTACFKCNTTKADRTPREAKMPLLSKATQPTWKDQMEGLRGRNPLWEKLL